MYEITNLPRVGSASEPGLRPEVKAAIGMAAVGVLLPVVSFGVLGVWLYRRSKKKKG